MFLFTMSRNRETQRANQGGEMKWFDGLTLSLDEVFFTWINY